MLEQHDPDKLFNLAVDAFGDYVTMTVDNRLRTATGLDIDWMRWFSGNVHQALGSVMLSSHDANHVTARLLTQLDMFLQMKENTGDFTDPCAMSLLTSSLVHPAVTHLNFLKTETHYIYNVVELPSQDVSEINQLKVLQLYELPWSIEMLSFSNLQELTLMTCDDSLLESLSVTCGNIRKLDVSSSRVVTDAGVEFLVKFQHLEEMNIKYTRISDDEGLTRLLTDLSRNKDPEGVSLLKSLGCNYLGPEQFRFLVSNFQNLVKLELVSSNGVRDVSLLTSLNHLQRLTIINGSYQLKDILEVIGHQLKELKFEYCFIKLDPCFIFKYCPSLVCLNVVTRDCPHVFDLTPQCNLKSLEVLDLTVYRHSNLACFILSNCTNVRVLKITCHYVNSNEIATAMLQNNPLEHLEELHWLCNTVEPLLPEVGRQIVRHCKNLEVMYGNIWWTRRRSRKPWFGNNGVDVFFQAIFDFHVQPRLI